MAALVGSELVFALDCPSCPDASSYEALENAFEIFPSAQSVAYGTLARGLCAADWQGAEETRLQRVVREQLLKTQLQRQQQQDQPLMVPRGDATGSVHSCSSTGFSRPPCSHCALPPPSLKQLCLALRLHGLDARLWLPVPLRGSGCGRHSTGGGGQCAGGAAGRRCCFCSRQPYATIRCPPSWPAEDDTIGQRQEPAQQQRQMAGVAVEAASEPTSTSSGGWCAPTPPPSLPSSEVVVVEPCLGELFTVAPSTPEYADLVGQLPQVWVGPRSALLELAERLCDAMAVNFRSQGLDVPPWRRRSAVLSRWDERHQHDISGELVQHQHQHQHQQQAMEVELRGLSRTAGAASASHRDQPTVPHPGRRTTPRSLLSAARSASALADAADLSPRPPQNKVPTAAPPLSAAEPAPVCGCDRPGGTGVGVVAAQSALGALPAGRSGAVNACCGPSQPPAPREPISWATDRPAAMAPPVVVYGFDLPGPARAV